VRYCEDPAQLADPKPPPNHTKPKRFMLPLQRRPCPSTAFSAWKPGAVPRLARLSLLALLLPSTLSLLPAGAGEITPTTGARGLGSLVNGQQNSCRSGSCAITGGTSSGSNLFHRFAAFDTRNGISGVSIDTTGKLNVIVGVTSAAGTFIDTSVQLLNGRANLFWLSPGGIQIGNGGAFVNTSQLTLSTATGLRINTAAGIGTFDAVETAVSALPALSGDPVPGPGGLVTERASLDQIGITNNGDLTLSGGLLTVDSSLLLDAQGGNVLLQGTGGSGVEIELTSPGGTALISGASATNTGSLTIDRPPGDLVGSLSFDTPFTHKGPQAVLGGSADLRMNQAFTWADGATIGGTSNGIERLITNGETIISGTIPLPIDRSLSNRGSLRFTDSASLTFLRPLRFVNDLSGEIILAGGASDPVPVVQGPTQLFNAGRIRKVSSSSQSLDVSGLQNVGSLDISAGSLSLNGTLTPQNGSINLANESTLAVGSDTLFNQGTISGTGTLLIGTSGAGTLDNSGTIAPGGEGTAGTLTIAGNFRQQPSGLLLIDLGGPAPGQSDRLAVTGTAELGGTLTTGLIAGYNPVAGDSIEVIAAGGGISGAFTTQNLPPNFEADSTGSIFRLVSLAPPEPPIPPEPPLPPEPPRPKPPIVERPQPPEPRPPIEPERPLTQNKNDDDDDELLKRLSQLSQINQKLFLLTALKTSDLVDDWRSRLMARLDEGLEDGSFSSSGETPASGAAAGRGVGPPTTLSTQQTREGFLQGESQAQRDTAGRLGLSQTAGGPAPTPEQLQCLLQEAADWVRGGRSPAQTRSEEEDPCRS